MKRVRKEFERWGPKVGRARHRCNNSASSLQRASTAVSVSVSQGRICSRSASENNDIMVVFVRITIATCVRWNYVGFVCLFFTCER